jgi:hypothetical protein
MRRIKGFSSLPGVARPQAERPPDQRDAVATPPHPDRLLRQRIQVSGYSSPHQSCADRCILRHISLARALSSTRGSDPSGAGDRDHEVNHVDLLAPSVQLPDVAANPPAVNEARSVCWTKWPFVAGPPQAAQDRGRRVPKGGDRCRRR